MDQNVFGAKRDGDRYWLTEAQMRNITEMMDELETEVANLTRDFQQVIQDHRDCDVARNYRQQPAAEAGDDGGAGVYGRPGGLRRFDGYQDRRVQFTE